MEKGNFRFEYGGNRKLKRVVSSWVKGENFGGYVIAGPSGCGKSTLLQELQAQFKDAKYSGIKVIEKMREQIIIGKSPTLSIDHNCKIIIIEDLDYLNGREATLDALCEMIRKYTFSKERNYRLIICTFVNESVALRFAKKMNYTVLSLKNVKPNMRIVKDKANDFGLEISQEQVCKFIKLDNMFELWKEFRKIKMNLLLN